MRRNRGLTLVEIIVVLAVLGLIMAVATPAINNALMMDQQAAAKSISQNYHLYIVVDYVLVLFGYFSSFATIV